MSFLYTAEIVPGLTKKIGRQKLVKGSRGDKCLIYSPPPAQDASRKASLEVQET